MTSQEPRTPHSVDRDIPDTEVIVVSSPASVFVDSTGRRRRLLRRLSYAFGGLCMVYGGLVSVSLAGGPVSSSVVLPLPDLRDDAEEAAGPRPAPIPTPSTSARPAGLSVADVAPRRRPTTESTRIAAPRPPVVSPAPAKTPASLAPTSAKPVESSAVPTVPTPVPSTPTADPTTDPPIKAPPINLPPVPPVPSAGGDSDDDSDGGDETVAAPAPSTQLSTEAADEPAGTPEPSVAAEGTA